MSSTERIEAARKLKLSAEQLLEKKMPFLEACGAVARYLCELGWDRRHPDFSIFPAVVSLTDHVPPAYVEKHWAPEALEGKNREALESEEQYRDRAEACCNKILKDLEDAIF